MKIAQLAAFNVTDKKTTPEQQNFEHSFLEAFDQFLEELGVLSARGISHDEFYRFLLQRMQTLTSAELATLWVQSSGDTWVPAISLGGSSKQLISNQELSHAYVQARPLSTRIGRYSVLIGRIESAASDQNLLLSLVLPAEQSQQFQRVYSDLVQAVGGVAEEFHRNELLNSQQSQFVRLKSLIQLINNSHTSLEPQTVGYNLTNDSRQFLQADRVWLFRAPDAVLLSCSGVANVNLRSRTSRHLQRVARMTIRSNQPLSWRRGESGTQTGSDALLTEYCQASSVDALYAVPVLENETKNAVAVLVVEMFGEHDRVSIMAQLNQLVSCVDSSITNSLQHSQIPFRRTLIAFNWLLNQFRWGQLFKTVSMLAFGIALLWSTFLIKSDFYVPVAGQLRPANERHVFAPSDGLVKVTSVEYGDEVKQSQIVARMVSPDYQLKLKQFQAQLDAARKKLETNTILRSAAVQRSEDEIALGQLTAEIEQNRLEMKSLNESISLYLRLTQQLEIPAPIDGQVISRDVSKTLLNRPVSAGNRLLTIADTKSDWQLVFDVPDREMGYLSANAAGNEKGWVVEYRLASELENAYVGKIDRFDANITFDEEGQPFVRAYCPIDKTEFQQLRVGQTVNGRVLCGRKSLFFIWTRDIRDFFRTHFFWM